MTKPSRRTHKNIHLTWGDPSSFIAGDAPSQRGWKEPVWSDTGSGPVQVPARQTLKHHLLPTCRVCQAITNSIKNVIKRFRSGAERKRQPDAKNGEKEGECCRRRGGGAREGYWEAGRAFPGDVRQALTGAEASSPGTAFHWDQEESWAQVRGGSLLTCFRCLRWSNSVNMRRPELTAASISC